RDAAYGTADGTVVSRSVSQRSATPVARLSRQGERGRPVALLDGAGDARYPLDVAATSAREKVVEKLVAWIWEQQALVSPLPADDGHQYQVVFRGRPWSDERGPDFQGAVLAREDGLLLRGDVEIHV